MPDRELHLALRLSPQLGRMVCAQWLLHCCHHILAALSQGLLRDFQSLTNAAVNSSLSVSAYFANTTGAWCLADFVRRALPAALVIEKRPTVTRALTALPAPDNAEGQVPRKVVSTGHSLGGGLAGRSRGHVRPSCLQQPCV